MGILFVFIFQLIAIGAFAGFLAAVIALLVYFLGPKERLQRRILASVVAPFLALYTIYFCLLASSIGLSARYDIDIGIGDSWYVPLGDSSQMVMIDLMDDAWVHCSDSHQETLVTHLAEDSDFTYAKTMKGEAFRISKTTGHCEDELKGTDEFSPDLDFQPVKDFYFKKKQELTGNWYYVILIGSLLMASTVVFISSRIIMRAFHKKAN